MPEGQLCALCRQRPVEPRWRPFCSKRCKTIDLGRWLSGEYRVAGRDVGDPDAVLRAADPDDVDLLES